jgi:hypothetical protein
VESTSRDRARPRIVGLATIEGAPGSLTSTIEKDAAMEFVITSRSVPGTKTTPEGSRPVSSVGANVPPASRVSNTRVPSSTVAAPSVPSALTTTCSGRGPMEISSTRTRVVRSTIAISVPGLAFVPYSAT